MFPGKLKSRWSGPFLITQVFPYGAVELKAEDNRTFKVNGSLLKHYYEGQNNSGVAAIMDLSTCLDIRKVGLMTINQVLYGRQPN